MDTNVNIVVSVVGLGQARSALKGFTNQVMASQKSLYAANKGLRALERKLEADRLKAVARANSGLAKYRRNQVASAQKANKAEMASSKAKNDHLLKMNRGVQKFLRTEEAKRVAVVKAADKAELASEKAKNEIIRRGNMGVQRFLRAEQKAHLAAAKAADKAEAASEKSKNEIIRRGNMGINRFLRAEEKARLTQEAAMHRAAVAARIQREQVAAARIVALRRGASAGLAMGANIGRGIGRVATAGLAGVGSVASGAIGAFSLLGRGLDRLAYGFINTGRQAQWLGRQIEFRLSLPILALIGYASKLYFDFDAAFVRLKKVFNDANADFEAIKGTVITLSNTTGIAATDIMEVGAAWAQAGATGDNFNQLLFETVRASALTGSSLEDTQKQLLSIVKAYGLTTSQLPAVINLFNRLENETSANFGQIAEVVRIAGATARQAGVPFAELAAIASQMIPAFGDAGEVGNSFKTIIAKLMAPTNEAAEAMQRLGINISEAEVQGLNFTERATLVAGAINEVGDSTRFVTAENIAQQRQLTKFFGILDTLLSKEYERISVYGDRASAADNARVAEEELMDQLVSDSGQLRIATTSMKNLLITGVQPLIPYILALVKQIKSLMEWFDQLDPSVKKVVFTFALFIGLLGPAMGILGSVGILIGSLVTGFLFLAKALLAPIALIGALISGFAALTGGPLILAAAGIGAVIWALTDLDGAVALVKRAINSLPSVFANALYALGRVVAGAVRAIWGWLQLLNPFHRQSPSLVDNVRAGVDIIMDEFRRLEEINLRHLGTELQRFHNTVERLRGVQTEAERGEQRELVLEFQAAALPKWERAIAAVDELREQEAKLAAQVEEAQAAYEAYGNEIEAAKEEQKAFGDVVAAQESVIDDLSRSLDRAEGELRAAQDEMSALQDEARGLESAIGDARGEIDRLSRMNIMGEHAADTEIFNLEQERKKIQLEMRKIELAFSHMEELPPHVAAEMKRLQKVMDELDLQIDIASLERDIEFDPLRRQIEELANPIEEMPFGDIINGIITWKEEERRLIGELEIVNDRIADQQVVVDNLTLARDLYRDALEAERATLEELKGRYDDMGESIREMEDRHGDMREVIQGLEGDYRDVGAAINVAEEDLRDFISYMEDLKTEAEQAARAAGELEDALAEGDFGAPDLGGMPDLNEGPGMTAAEIEEWAAKVQKDMADAVGAISLRDGIKRMWGNFANEIMTGWDGIDYGRVSRLIAGAQLSGVSPSEQAELVANIMGLPASTIPEIEAFRKQIEQAREDFYGDDYTPSMGIFDENIVNNPGFLNNLTPPDSTGIRAWVEEVRGYWERLTVWWDENGPEIRAGVQEMRDNVVGAFDAIVNSPLMVQARETFNNIKDGISEMVDKAGGWKNVLIALGVIIGVLMIAFGPVSLTIAAIVAALIALEASTGAVSKVFEALAPILGGMFRAIGGLVKFVVGVLSGDWDLAWEGAKDVVMGIVTVLWETVKLVKESLEALGRWLWDNKGEIWGKIKEGLSWAWDGLKGLWNDTVWPAIKGFFTGIGSWLGEHFGLAWGNVKLGLSWVWTGLKDLWNQIVWPGIKGFFTGIGSWLGENFSRVWGEFKGGLSWAWDAISGLWNDTVWPGIKGFFTGIGSWLLDNNPFGKLASRLRIAWGALRDLWNLTIKSRLQGLFTGFKDWLSRNNPFSGIAGLFSTAWNAVTRVWDGIVGGMSSVLKKVLGIDNSTWELRLPTITQRTIDKATDATRDAFRERNSSSPPPPPDNPNAGHSISAAGNIFGPGGTVRGMHHFVGEGSRLYREYAIPTDPKYRNNALALFGQLASDLGVQAPAMSGPSSSTSISGDTNLHFHGDLSFPNITSGDDAELLLENLEAMR